jgi:radical SAM superfamily enzyme YgiQ (UPF0313 family)
MSTIKAVISSVPWSDTSSPLLAPAVLKSSLERQKIPTVAIDLNAEVRKYLEDRGLLEIAKEFFFSETVANGHLQDIHSLFEFMADRLLSYRSEWIGLSLLTFMSQASCRWLCFLLKKRNPNIRIIIGGPGIFVSLKNIDTFASSLKTQGLIDYYIAGDGEDSLPALIKGNTEFAGVNSINWKQLADLNDTAFPNFNDYDFSIYRVRATPIVGSRGCVRECTFCDVHEHWEKFQWRTAESIFEEIKIQHERYGINVFNFSDSLINGNQKEYRQLIKLLADYNRDRSKQERIEWTSFFIFRPETAMSDEDWRLTAESGAILLRVGVESFVDHIRLHMKKKFNNVDLDNSLKMAKKYQIPLVLLIIVGYTTETEEDHQESLNWIKQNSHYANDSVYSIRIGNTLAILPGTWIYQHREEYNIKLGTSDLYTDWIREDIGSTPQVRLRRHRELRQALTDNGFKVDYTEDAHVFLENYFNEVK